MKIFIILSFILGVLVIYKYYTRKKCPEGTVGNNCEYNELDNCNGNGKVSLNNNGDPICSCNANFAGENCEKCKDGLIGYYQGCNYSDNKTCNGRGKVYINSNGDPYCICNHPFDGKNCEKCKKDFAGSECQYKSEEMCVGNGEVYVDKNDNPKCRCKDGWTGEYCNRNDKIRCNRNGIFDLDKNKCVCFDGFAGTTCQFSSEYCLNGGKLYDYNDRVTPAKISCSCKDGYKGSICQFDEKKICGERGILSVFTDINGNDVIAGCTCKGNFENKNKKDCTECKDGFYGINCDFSDKNCNGYPLSNLSEYPIISFDCKCPGETPFSELSGKDKISGKTCKYIDRETCNNRGYIETINNELSKFPEIKCKCDSPTYKGDKCESCITGFKGPNCEYSDSTTCNARGIVSDNGSCSCSSPYEGPNCNKCKNTNSNGKKYYELRLNEKLVCATEDDCNNRGKPSLLLSDGRIKCICNNGYTGDNCNTVFLK